MTRIYKTGLKKMLLSLLHTMPHAVSMLIIVAHASEIVRVTSHISPVQVAVAALLFIGWISARHNLAEEV